MMALELRGRPRAGGNLTGCGFEFFVVNDSFAIVIVTRKERDNDLFPTKIHNTGTNAESQVNTTATTLRAG